MKKQIVKEFITIKKVKKLPKPIPPPPPPPPRTILVVGCITLIIAIKCDEYPKPGATARSRQGFWRMGGIGANICTALVRLGLKNHFLAPISNLPEFQAAQSTVQTMGIEMKMCPRLPFPPSYTCSVYADSKQSRSVLNSVQKHHQLTFQQFLGAVDYRLYNWMHFQMLDPPPMAKMMRAVRDYNERADDDIIISVDLLVLCPRQLVVANLADYVFVNTNVKQTNAFLSGYETVHRVRDMMKSTHRRWLSMQKKKFGEDVNPSPSSSDNCDKPTKGPIIVFGNIMEGSCCLLPDDKFIQVGPQPPTVNVEPIGTHGTFVAAFIYALLEAKLNLRDALEYATRINKLKASTPGFDHLRCAPKDLKSFYYA